MTFDTGLLSCMEDKANCLDTICCMPCQIGRQCAALEGQVNTGNVLYCCMAMMGFSNILICAIRFKVNEKYNLDEACPLSCCQAWLCPQCSLCQTHRQLTQRNDWPGGVCQSKPYTASMS